MGFQRYFYPFLFSFEPFLPSVSYNSALVSFPLLTFISYFLHVFFFFFITSLSVYICFFLFTCFHNIFSPFSSFSIRELGKSRTYSVAADAVGIYVSPFAYNMILYLPPFSESITTSLACAGASRCCVGGVKGLSSSVPPRVFPLIIVSHNSL